MKTIFKIPRIYFKNVTKKQVIVGLLSLIVLLSGVFSSIYLNNKLGISTRLNVELESKNRELLAQIDNLKLQIQTLQNEDQRKVNKELSDKLKLMEETYKKSVSVYESLLDLKELSRNTTKLDQLYANSIQILALADYTTASTKLIDLSKQIETERLKVSASLGSLPQNAPVNNTPPGSGYSRQAVKTDTGTFTVNIISADLGSTRVIVDTASDSDCTNNCPVLPLSTYVSRNNAYAGINGSYFCPASYPTCSGKTNSFDLLVMNKNKHYFNSDNNVYSNNPAVIFGGSYVRFVSAASQWGRDTGIDSMLSNYPLLIEGGNIRFSGNSDPKMTSRGPRGFVGNKGNTVYIGFVNNATMTESAQVLKALGMENAMNLDEGGSTALWSGGYKLGPGRDIPNAILFVRK